MNNVPFTLSQVRPIRDAMTVSRPSGLGYGVPVTWFSLGAGTSITPEYYDCTTLYLGGEGNGKFLLGVDGQEVSVKPGEVLYVPPKTLCGTKTDSGMIYTEIILKKENFTMNNIIKAGQPTELKNLISYEEGSIANLDIAHIDLLDVEICRQSHRRAVLQAVQERFNASDDTHIGKVLVHFDLQVGLIPHFLLEQMGQHGIRAAAVVRQVDSVEVRVVSNQLCSGQDMLPERIIKIIVFIGDVQRMAGQMTQGNDLVSAFQQQFRDAHVQDGGRKRHNSG